MKSYEWNISKQVFIEVDDPIFDPTLDTVGECLSKARYFSEISSDGDNGSGATVTVYSTEEERKPRFYVDVMGQNTSIATFVARDFLSLLATLREIHPLLTLVGLDQFSTARIADEVERDTR